MTSSRSLQSGVTTLAVGLMSGTSLDGIDAALLETDGEGVVRPLETVAEPYGGDMRDRLRAALHSTARSQALDALERDLTLAHARLVERLLREAGRSVAEIGVVGFHGHTILHRPAERRTWQIGDGALLARETSIDVVADFRSADVAAGGEGAPLAPVYHAALASGLEKPVVFLNVGGVANVTWIGAAGDLMAFDTGPGNALIDDWMLRRRGAAADIDGRLAAAGRVDEGVLARLLANPYFDAPPPKSLDRDHFDAGIVEPLGDADGAATLADFTAAAVARAVDHMPAAPRRWIVCGGGRRNPVLMEMLARRLPSPVEPVEALKCDGDMIEAQAFAYLAVRSLRGLPISWPATTGASAPLRGGRHFPHRP